MIISGIPNSVIRTSLLQYVNVLSPDQALQSCDYKNVDDCIEIM